MPIQSISVPMVPFPPSFDNLQKSCHLSDHFFPVYKASKVASRLQTRIAPPLFTLPAHFFHCYSPLSLISSTMQFVNTLFSFIQYLFFSPSARPVDPSGVKDIFHLGPRSTTKYCSLLPPSIPSSFPRSASTLAPALSILSGSTAPLFHLSACTWLFCPSLFPVSPCLFPSPSTSNCRFRNANQPHFAPQLRANHSTPASMVAHTDYSKHAESNSATCGHF
jgi:hypothetical protein